MAGSSSSHSAGRRRTRHSGLDSVAEDCVERSRDVREIKRIDEQARVADLSMCAAAHEPPELLVRGALAPRRHLLERPQPTEIALGTDDFFDGADTQRADQLVLQIRYAHVEPEVLHFRPAEVAPKTSALERRTKDRFLAGVAEAGEPGTTPRIDFAEERPDPVRASERNDPNSRVCKSDAPSLSKRFERDLVAQTFNDDYRAHRRLHTHRLCRLRPVPVNARRVRRFRDG
jgi:hypothetical protein